MTRDGSTMMGLLDGLHGEGCDGTEYSRMQAVPLSGSIQEVQREGQSLEIVFMKWCGECEAAEWDYV